MDQNLLLRRKNYRQDSEKDENSLFENICDLQTEDEASASNFVNPVGDDIKKSYEYQYRKLLKWVDNSLDLYREGLFQVMFPVLVHSYLDLIEQENTERAVKMLSLFSKKGMENHKDEIQQLNSVLEKIHIREHSLCLLFRKNKYIVPMSKYSLHLLIQFIQENGLNLIQKIINQYIKVKIVEETTSPNGIFYFSEKEDQINKETVLWGQLNPPRVTEKDISNFLYREPQKCDDLKELNKQETFLNELSPSIQRIPLPEVNLLDVQKEISKLKELGRKRTSHSPSVCSYNVYNTNGGLVSLSFSPDCSFAFGGFQDSYIGAWCLKEEPLCCLKPSTELAAINLTNIPTFDELFSEKKQNYVRMIGHHGPVYSTQAFPSNQFLLSCSQDATVRLWCLNTFSSISVYKGHKHPVWDMKLGPCGYYFATGSADRTAKLWSTERQEALRMFYGHVSDVNKVCFHPNSNYVATGSSDKTCRLWDVQTGKSVRLFTGPTTAVIGIEISPCGKYLACLDLCPRIYVWEIGSGKKVYFSSVLKKKINYLCFSPHSDLLALSGAQGDVLLVDFKNGVDIAHYKAKGVSLYNLFFMNSNLIVTGGHRVDDY